MAAGKAAEETKETELIMWTHSDTFRFMEIKDAVVKARIEPSLKHQTEAILQDLGISTTEAIRMFFNQVRLRKGLPFEVRIPGAETQTAIDELEAGKGQRFKSVDALFVDLDD